MKPKYYTINDLGEVTEVSPLSRGLSMPEISAQTKAEATSLFLLQAKHVLKSYPRLFVKNGAYMLVYPNGEDLNVETGRLDRTTSAGDVFPLCSGRAKNEQEIKENKDFAYYSSEEYVKAS